MNLKPNYVGAFGNLGNVLKDSVRLEETTVPYRQVITIIPQKAKSLNNLGVALNAMNNGTDAFASL